MSNPNLSKLTTLELLRLYAELMELLRARGVVKSNNTPVADYGEKVIADHLRLKLQGNSNKGYDAQDQEGIRYQIKVRRITRHNGSRQLSVIRSLEEGSFDYLLAGIFNEWFELKELWKIPHGRISAYSRYNKYQNGHTLHLRGPLLTDSAVQRLI